MKCTACGGENPAASRFCESCGTALGSACAACGASLGAGARFCNQCGAPQAQGQPRAASSPVSVPQRSSGPISYTPKHLADKILRSRTALEGERKQVTVLLADVQGSMALSESLDPEAWHRMMDGFFEVLTTVVHRFEGTINQYTGDGVMALFGAPIAHEDHAQRACYAALRLTEEVERYARELKRTHGVGFSVRIGLNSGDVVVGKIGDDLRMDYTAQGHTVGLAARMEQLADPGKVYLTENTAAIVRGYFELDALGEFQVKGASEPVKVYSLRSTGTLRTRLDLSRARGFSRFVGRASEMHVLEAALEQALAGNGQIVGVVGEAGVGKSRLCYEFIERCRARGITGVEAHCLAHGKLVPLMPILELLRNIFGITDRDSERDARRKIAGTLVLLADDIGDDLSLVLDLMGVPDPARPTPTLDPDVRMRRLSSLVKRLVRARSDREPAVMLIDDVHWIDATSDVHLAHWVEAIRGTRTLLLLNFRPEYRAEWMGRSYHQQLALQPLTAEVAKAFLRETLGADSSLEGLPERIVERSAGNPFFMEEIVQSLVEGRKLIGDRGAFRLRESADRLAIPATVQTILAARIDRLEEREKRVLQAAAVIGRTVPEPVLRRVVEIPPTELETALRALTEAEFLFEQTIYPEAEYAFKHPLTQEVAYASQLTDKRQRTHASVARAIAEVDAGRLDERAALLASHWEQAGDAWEAAEWHGRAGAWCGHRDSAGALYHWQASWDRLLTIDPSPARDALVVKASTQILFHAPRAGMSLEGMTGVFEHGRPLAERLGDVGALVLLNYRYAVAAMLAGEPASALRELVAETRRLSETSNDPGVRLVGTYATSLSTLAATLAETLEAYDSAWAICAGDPRIGQDLLGEMLYHRILWGRAQALAYMGRFEQARQDVQRLLKLAAEVGATEPDVAVLAQGMAVQVGYVAQDAPEPMLMLAREMVGFAQRSGAAVMMVYAYSVLGMANLSCQRWDDAIDAVEQSLAVQNTTRTALVFQAYAVTTLASAHSARGEFALAREAADRAVELAVRFGIKRIEARARITRAAVLIASGDPGARAAAREDLDAADGLRREIGARVFEPMIRVHEAELAKLNGDETGRRALLKKARELFTEMQMTGWLKQLDAMT